MSPGVDTEAIFGDLNVKRVSGQEFTMTIDRKNIFIHEEYQNKTDNSGLSENVIIIIINYHN